MKQRLNKKSQLRDMAFIALILALVLGLFVSYSPRYNDCDKSPNWRDRTNILCRLSLLLK